MKRGQALSQGQLPIHFLSNQDIDSNNQNMGERIFLLLHGYCETGDKIYHCLIDTLPSGNLIVAPNGLYPIPKSFPLEKRKSSEDLLQGHAWYFYDATKDHFLIDYDIPAHYLSSFLHQINPKNLPVTLIGYSQGGYLCPFVAQKYSKIDHIIGINCSYRVDKLDTLSKVRIDSINGDCDLVVDPQKAKERHQKLILKGCSGKFNLIENEAHKLTPVLVNMVKELVKQFNESLE